MRESLWEFSCRVYLKPSVESTCMVLQDEYGWNIPLAFYGIWAGIHYGILPPTHIRKIQDFALQYSSLSIIPLRSIRRKMKTGYRKDWPISVTHWQNLRKKILATELEGEKTLLEAMQTYCDAEPKWENFDTFSLENITMSNVLKLMDANSCERSIEQATTSYLLTLVSAAMCPTNSG